MRVCVGMMCPFLLHNSGFFRVETSQWDKKKKELWREMIPLTDCKENAGVSVIVTVLSPVTWDWDLFEVSFTVRTQKHPQPRCVSCLEEAGKWQHRFQGLVSGSPWSQN